MIVDMTKKYRTRDGREVRIYAIDGNGLYCVHGAHTVKEYKGWISGQWSLDGDFFSPSFEHMRLIEVKPRIKRDIWINIYDREDREWDFWHCHPTREEADRYSTIRRIACVKITVDCEEGDGL